MGKGFSPGLNESQNSQSRIFLDNFNNLQSSWVTQGAKIGQVSLYYGSKDMGSTMMEENVVAAAGTVYSMDEEEIKRLITDSGFTPQRRNMKYDYLPTPVGKG